MKVSSRAVLAWAVVLAAGLLAALLASSAGRAPGVPDGAASYYVSPSGSDRNSGTAPDAPLATIQKAVDLAGPGDVIDLAPGVYMQDVVSRRDGTESAPITIRGPASAVVKGGGAARIVEINHDYITLDGFTIDGLWGARDSTAGYRDKLLYALGKRAHDGVSGLKVLHMHFRNAGDECLRLRYFAQRNEIAYSSFVGCGVQAFKFKAGGKNGEAIYIGTAPEQRANGDNPTADPDQSSMNWIHHNTFDTQGNECVDIKEASSGNIVEHNTCTGQRDPSSAGFDARGSNNIFRYNESYGNAGAGIRLGGDGKADGTGNDVYANNIHDNRAGGIKFQRQPQRQVCGNIMAGNRGGDLAGKDIAGLDPTAACADLPQGDASSS